MRNLRRSCSAVVPLAWLVLGLVVSARPASADGALIRAEQCVDAVFDAARGLVYVSSGNSVLRGDVKQGVLLEPFAIPGEGTHLMGIDLSPDGNTLVVADANSSGTETWVYAIDLKTGAVAREPFAAAAGETGTYAVAFAKDGTVFVTSRSAAGRAGSVPMRRLEPRSGEWRVFIDSVPSDAMVSASGDLSVIGFAGTRDKGGVFGRIRVQDGDVAAAERRQPAYEIAVNADGTQFVVPSQAEKFVYDQTLALLGVALKTDNRFAAGAAYHPKAPFLHLALRGAPLVSVFDSRNLSKVSGYVLPTAIEAPIEEAFAGGRLRMARDGSLLMCTMPGGVWISPVHEVPWAHDQSVETSANTQLPVKLAASTVHDAGLTYELDRRPEHGTLTGTAQDLTYVPDQGYVGPDSFTFRARCGDERSAVATVSIGVKPGGATEVVPAGKEEQPPAGGDGTCRAWALAYGCAEYGDPVGGQNLWLVPCNVTQMVNTFHYRLGIPWENMVVRIDEIGPIGNDLTPDRIKSDIAEIAARADADDIAVFYYCGHGDANPEGGATSEKLCLGKGDMTDRALGAALAQLPCGNTLVILDSCYSGGFAISPDELTGECASLDPKHIVYVVAACERTRVATGYEFPERWPWLGATLFTPLFAEAMEGGMPAWKRKDLLELARDIPLSSDLDGDGVITLLEAFTYARDACARISVAMGTKQTPVMGPEIPRQAPDIGLAQPLPAEVLAQTEPWLTISTTKVDKRRTEAGAEISLYGEVTDRAGHPVPGVRLMVNDALVSGDRSTPGMLTDAQGRFTHHSASATPHGPQIWYTFWCPGADPKVCVVDGKSF
jgi:hypothetical protein